MPVICLLFCFAPEALSQWKYIGPDSTSNVLSLVADTSLGAVPTLFAGTASGVYESTDDGSTWQPVGFQNKVIYALALHGPYLFAGVERGGVYRTLADSISWVSMNSGITTTNVLSLAVVPNDTGGAVVLAGVTGGVFRSTNDGVNWLATTLTTGNGIGFAYWADRHTDSTIYVTTNLTTDSSIDGGATWGLIGNNGVAIAVLHDQQGNAIFYDSPGEWLVYAALPYNGWNEVDSGIPHNANIASLAVVDTNLYAGVTGNIYLSTNEGTEWTAIGDSLPGSPVGVIAADKSYLLAATQGNGIWKRPFSDFIIASVKQPARGLPTEYTLSQNYPNPFNPTTMLGYTVPERSRVTIRLYDLLGRIVATLVDREVEPGEHLQQWNGSGASSGVYFATMSAASADGKIVFSTVRKILLMK